MPSKNIGGTAGKVKWCIDQYAGTGGVLSRSRAERLQQVHPRMEPRRLLSVSDGSMSNILL
jgi:hypothetical protein